MRKQYKNTLLTFDPWLQWHLTRMPPSFTRSLWEGWWAYGSLWKTLHSRTAACGSYQDHTTVISNALSRFMAFYIIWAYMILEWSFVLHKFVYLKWVGVALFMCVKDGITRRMVRTPKGTFPLTDFIGREKNYDDKLFVPAPVKKGELMKLLIKHFWN